MVDLSKLQSAFSELSSSKPRCFSAPGRLNLIGEHTDYNEGFVLPMAANLRSYVAAARRDDDQVRVHSVDLNQTASFACDSERDIQEGWLAYISGMTQTLTRLGLDFRGADLAILSEVPIGSGLSSSAALEIAVGFALVELSESNIGLLELALAAQQAEHEFVGTRSGLMDQLTATFAEKNHAMLIDCRSLDVNQIPMNLSSIAIAICDTKVKHALVSSAYNQRRLECERAVELLQDKKSNVCALRDLRPADLDLIEELPEPQRSRARHVVTENDRTLRAAKALEANDVTSLGELMVQSHRSLRDDFAVSSRELDIMFELAQAQEGVAGARMMGGGFGGCTINLVERASLDTFTGRMMVGYEQSTGIVPLIKVVEPDAGVSELSC